MKKKYLLLGAWLCLSTSTCHALTLAAAKTEVRRLIKDTATSSTLQRYSDTILTAFLNQSQREVVTATWCLQNSSNRALVANTTSYSLPTDLIAVKLVRFLDSGGKIRNLYETSYKAVSENNPDYARQTGPPMQYTLRYSQSSATPLDIIFLPIAISASQLGTATIDYYQQSADLVNDSDVFLNGFVILLPYHEAIVYQTVGKIKTIEGDTTGAALYFQLYSSALNDMNSRLGERPNLNPGFSASTPGSSSSIGR